MWPLPIDDDAYWKEAESTGQPLPGLIPQADKENLGCSGMYIQGGTVSFDGDVLVQGHCF